MCRSLFRTKDILKLSSEEATTFNFLTKKVYRSHSVMRNTTSCNRIKHNKPGLKYKGFIYFLLAKKVQIAKLHLSTCLLAQSISENVCYDLGAALTFEHSF